MRAANFRLNCPHLGLLAITTARIGVTRNPINIGNYRVPVGIYNLRFFIHPRYKAAYTPDTVFAPIGQKRHGRPRRRINRLAVGVKHHMPVNQCKDQIRSTYWPFG